MKYRTTVDRLGHPAGTIVYPCRYCDYGLSSDDTRASGVPHMAVTLNETGDYPFFTIPVAHLQEIDHVAG